MGVRLRQLDQDDTGGFTEEVRAVLTFDSGYTTGGELLDADKVPFRVGNRIDSVEFETHPLYAFDYDRVDDRSGQLVVYQSAAGLTEVPNATDLSAVEILCTIKGR